MWGVLRQLIELVQQQDDGKYLLLKDPNAVMHFDPQSTPWGLPADL